MVYFLWVMIMPRTARKSSGSNIYHVMLRGINRQNIFEDDEDRFFFLNTLQICKESSEFRLHAFCLMTNHVHLLIEPAEAQLETIFKRVGTRYAGWYNRKYQRTGHLFQDRFRSENVETDQYFMTVLRYILWNPAKAGLEMHPGSYRWSSYLAYVRGGGAITDTEYAVNLFGGRKALVEFLGQIGEEEVMDEENCDRRLREDRSKKIMQRISGCESVAAFQTLDSALQKQYAREMFRERLSLGQISRMTGVPKTTVFRMIQESQEPEEKEELIFHESGLSECGWETDVIW